MAHSRDSGYRRTACRCARVPAGWERSSSRITRSRALPASSEHSPTVAGPGCAHCCYRPNSRPSQGPGWCRANLGVRSHRSELADRPTYSCGSRRPLQTRHRAREEPPRPDERAQRRRLVLAATHRVGVDAERELRVGVPELAHHRRRVAAQRDQHRTERVAQLVRRHALRHTKSSGPVLRLASLCAISSPRSAGSRSTTRTPASVFERPTEIRPAARSNSCHEAVPGSRSRTGRGSGSRHVDRCRRRAHARSSLARRTARLCLRRHPWSRSRNRPRVRRWVSRSEPQPPRERKSASRTTRTSTGLQAGPSRPTTARLTARPQDSRTSPSCRKQEFCSAAKGSRR